MFPNRRLDGSLQVSTPRPPAAWERLLAWLVLLFALLAAGVLAYPKAGEPRLFWNSVASGGVPLYPVFLAGLLVAAAVLLVLMHRWAFSLLIVHLVLAFAYLTGRHGTTPLSGMAMAAFGVEVLAVVFAGYLMATGKLK